MYGTGEYQMFVRRQGQAEIMRAWDAVITLGTGDAKITVQNFNRPKFEY